MYNISLQAPKLDRKCEIKHWYACGADGRKVGRSVYGHVIAKFSRMDRFSKLWSSAQNIELSPWSNKISAENELVIQSVDDGQQTLWFDSCQLTFFRMESIRIKGDVTRDNWQRRFLAQHSVATLLRHGFE